jgi:hypothetical protein
MRKTGVLLLLGVSLLLGACAEATGPSPQATVSPPDSSRDTASGAQGRSGADVDYAVSW